MKKMFLHSALVFSLAGGALLAQSCGSDSKDKTPAAEEKRQTAKDENAKDGNQKPEAQVDCLTQAAAGLSSEAAIACVGGEQGGEVSQPTEDIPGGSIPGSEPTLDPVKVETEKALAIVAERCATCHGAGRTKPELVTLENIKAKRDAVLEAVSSGAMPLGAPLAPEQKDTLVKWLKESPDLN